jgi:hypothetical protein
MEDQISELKNKIEIKEKTEGILVKQLKCCKGICKNSATPSKDQTRESRALKKDKRYKPKRYVRYSIK